MVWLYRRFLVLLLIYRIFAYAFLGVVGFLLVALTLLFYICYVVVKMLPFDNKSEIQLVIDMSEGMMFEETVRVVQVLGRYVKTVPKMQNYQTYVRTTSPFNFSELIHHYYLHEQPHETDIQPIVTGKQIGRAHV